MRKFYLLAFTLLLLVSMVHAQYNTNQNKVWAFGFGGGIDFNSGVPVPFTSNMATNEGCASVSDASGNLLFYTNGTIAYNRTGAIMPNGIGLSYFTTVSTTQASVIVPIIDSPDKYYIFSLVGVLRYSKVDMTLDGGNGAVVPYCKAIRIDSPFSEKMTVVRGNGCNIWLLLHSFNDTKFYAYNITTSGISAPVISTAGSYWHMSDYYNIYGEIIVSPDRHKLVTGSMDIPKGLGLYDFDPTSGIVSNGRVLDSTHAYYGAEFSPDCSKLYAVHENGGSMGSSIDQYDITLPTTLDIISSVMSVGIGSVGGISHLKLGPDGKIYMNRLSDFASNYLDVINYPNVSGGGCNYVSHAVTLNSGTYGFLGLPNIYYNPGMDAPSSFNTHDTAHCILPGDTITLFPHGHSTQYEWYDGTIDTFHKVTSYGSYWIKSAGIGCVSSIDTIKVHPVYDTIYKHSDTLVCIHNELDTCTLKAPDGSYFLWYDGSTDSFITVRRTGDYIVCYTINCDRYIDTIHANFQYYPDKITGLDTICAGNTTTLYDATPGGIWSSSATTVATIMSSNGLCTGITGGNSMISYIAPDGCAETKNITVLSQPCISAVSPEPIDRVGVELFPNPATDKIIVNLNSTFGKSGQLIISDISGREIHNYFLNDKSSEFSVTDFAPGVYLCHFIFNDANSSFLKLSIIR